ncbi:MAG: 26 kDa periplasmic immunogenic protein precursor [candidate division WS6 bacterium OLB20]|uniref:26 kDa periplasmic immunogenic protein n=1 Tax=candidate division WS6 bacterium OLB20 TaxID=1617426 RepID=A0A136M0J4_9BACT|nr:MAG: 26 kDa periplasmic immunogenic protein precursor [candidate division WS6 bacterium OLB20]
MPHYVREYLKTVFTFATKAMFVFFLVLILVMLAFAQLFRQSQQLQDPQHYRVQGTAERKVTPDTIYLTVGTRVEGSDIVAIQTEANNKINAAVKAIENLGIPKENIRTSEYALNPEYDREGRDITGYSVNIEVRVTVEDATLEENKAGDVIKVASGNGLNEVRSLSYEVSNREEILEELKLEAIEDAKGKKDAVADAAGLRLGDLKSVEEGYYYPYYDNFGRAETVSDGAAAAPSVQISPGQSELSITVTLVYEIL